MFTSSPHSIVVVVLIIVFFLFFPQISSQFLPLTYIVTRVCRCVTIYDIFQFFFPRVLVLSLLFGWIIYFSSHLRINKLSFSFCSFGSLVCYIIIVLCCYCRCDAPSLFPPLFFFYSFPLFARALWFLCYSRCYPCLASTLAIGLL
ncbi:hypothetical protein, unlikely [Trypanosoma brucei gambiense DAL972]|uniref:Uncharacterized protein n=1 Tax=Trypanosoma brucei gambiense (strain MHOM/CI/86/DAL972) TaxID=679716 RepID=D0A0K5_TRYB9|nr:hypothetical protein, unlikely [Trypanosoma brucei gambiense DAL972]CBH16763.1 hypothetical protein, unlikely [Trypanosoma brucei gambiense DAL972]|eukprot:XP_011779027.1 hypothetical protein, unlikely [Trypanosoma brucei gambiense DAL972]